MLASGKFSLYSTDTEERVNVLTLSMASQIIKKKKNPYCFIEVPIYYRVQNLPIKVDTIMKLSHPQYSRSKFIDKLYATLSCLSPNLQ